MKSISIRDVIASIISSILIVCLFTFVILTVLLFAIYIVMAFLLTVFGIMVYPLTGELPSVSNLFGLGLSGEIYLTSLKFIFSMFTEWTFYVLIFIVSIIDLFIRKLKVRIVTNSMYVNGIVSYLIISAILSFIYMLLPSLKFDGSEFKIAFNIVFIFFLAHFHLTLLLYYILEKGPKFFGKIKLKLKMKRYSVEDNDSKF